MHEDKSKSKGDHCFFRLCRAVWWMLGPLHPEQKQRPSHGLSPALAIIHGSICRDCDHIEGPRAGGRRSLPQQPCNASEWGIASVVSGC